MMEKKNGRDSVDFALEKLYGVVESHLNSLPAAERDRRLAAISGANSRLPGPNSERRSKSREIKAY